VGGYSEFENANPNLCQTPAGANNLLAFIGAVGELQGLYGVQPGGARNLCDGTTGEFHELGGFANDQY
jgi:hypothetical protein